MFLFSSLDPISLLLVDSQDTSLYFPCLTPFTLFLYSLTAHTRHHGQLPVFGMGNGQVQVYVHADMS